MITIKEYGEDDELNSDHVHHPELSDSSDDDLTREDNKVDTIMKGGIELKTTPSVMDAITEPSLGQDG